MTSIERLLIALYLLIKPENFIASIKSKISQGTSLPLQADWEQQALFFFKQKAQNCYAIDLAELGEALYHECKKEPEAIIQDLDIITKELINYLGPLEGFLSHLGVRITEIPESKFDLESQIANLEQEKQIICFAFDENVNSAVASIRGSADVLSFGYKEKIISLAGYIEDDFKKLLTLLKDETGKFICDLKLQLEKISDKDLKEEIEKTIFSLRSLTTKINTLKDKVVSNLDKRQREISREFLFVADQLKQRAASYSQKFSAPAESGDFIKKCLSEYEEILHSTVTDWLNAFKILVELKQLTVQVEGQDIALLNYEVEPPSSSNKPNKEAISFSSCILLDFNHIGYKLKRNARDSRWVSERIEGILEKENLLYAERANVEQDKVGIISLYPVSSHESILQSAMSTEALSPCVGFAALGNDKSQKYGTLAHISGAIKGYVSLIKTILPPDIDVGMLVKEIKDKRAVVEAMVSYTNQPGNDKLRLYIASSENHNRLLLQDIIMALVLQIAQRQPAEAPISIDYLLANKEPAGFMLDMAQEEAVLSSETKRRKKIDPLTWLNHGVNYIEYPIKDLIENSSLLEKGFYQQSPSAPSSSHNTGIASLGILISQEGLASTMANIQELHITEEAASSEEEKEQGPHAVKRV